MPASVELSPLFDPTLERVGFPLDHPYVEQVYCSVLGPSSVMLLRRAGQLFAEHPEGHRLDVVDLSRSLGLGVRAEADDVGRHAPLRRTMDRLVRFRMAEWRGDDRLGVHPNVAAIESHRIERLPESVQARHHELLSGHIAGLVARAEGRNLAPVSVASIAAAEPAAPSVERQESPVAARLRAFAANSVDPRTVIR